LFKLVAIIQFYYVRVAERVCIHNLSKILCSEVSAVST